MQAWARCINQSLSGIGPSRINGIGFAMPGPFNYRTGMAMFEGNDKYEALYEVSIADELKPWLNLGQEVELRFMNDATSFAVGCAWAGEASKYERAVALTLGTGMGSAFIEKGIPIVNRADVAPHGSLWHLPVREGIADDYFSTRWFVKNYNARFGVSEAGVKAIAEAARKKPEARALFEAALRVPAVDKRLEWWDAEEGPLPNPDIRYPKGEQPAAFVCSEGRCSLPIIDPAEIAVFVAELRTAPEEHAD